MRPLSTPAKSRGDLLFPGFAISVTAEGDCTAFLDRACRQALADHGGVLRAVRQGTGVLGVRRTAKGWGEEVIPRASKSNGGATYLAASAGPGSGWPGDDGFPGDGFPGEESEPAAGMLRFSYRSEHFDVDEDWFWEWLIDWATIYRSNSASAGYVSSAEDTLDAVISQFRSEAYGDPEDYDVLMGCWNVHREAWEWDYLYYFWTEGWGAPREMFRLMAQMISTYWEDVDYTEFEDQELCEGFAEFVRKAVRGQTATRRNDHLEEGDFGYDWPESCYMVVNYRNKTDYERVRGACTLSGGATRDGTEETCNDYFDTNKPCDDEDWNELDPIYDPSSKCVKAFSDEATCAAPRALCSGGIGADWSITLPPRRVVFDGVTADWVLHLARMCFDYGRTLEFADFADYYTTAGRLGRYALGVAANAANVWIHEFGHTYLGGGHCSNDLNCCFDNAADAWQCRVRANLGLPLGPYDRHVFGQDFDNPDQSIFFDECSSCSTENGVVRHKYVFCDTGVGGSVGESAVFLATKCREEGDCETDSGTVVLTDQTFSPAWRELSLRDDADKALKEREDLFHGFR